MEENGTELTVFHGDKENDIVVRPGTTTQDVLRHLNLSDGFWLSRRDGLPFGHTEIIYGQVAPGEKLFVSAEASVADQEPWR